MAKVFMSSVQRIARNTTVLLVANVASFALGFFFTMYVARYLGAEGFGVLAFALAFTAVFGVLTDIGLQPLMVREIARDEALARKYIANVSALKILLVTITFGLIALVINLMDYPAETIKVVYLMALSVVFNAFSTMLYGVFRAYERMEFEALGQVLSSALVLSGAFYAMSHDFSVVGFALLYCIASVVTLGYSAIISAWRFVLPSIEIDLGFWKKTLKQA
jgi:O-antigen/teichoic acid export membrane protein